MKRQLWCVLGMVGALLLSGCGDETAEPPAASDVWTATPQAPLSPREMAVAVTIGDRVLVVGGSNAPPCPPNAECELPEQPPLTDGAMFDLVTGRWTRIAAAPVPLGGYVDSSAAVVGATVYVLSDWYVSETRTLRSRSSRTTPWRTHGPCCRTRQLTPHLGSSSPRLATS
jgi:Kelch motif